MQPKPFPNHKITETGRIYVAASLFPQPAKARPRVVPRKIVPPAASRAASTTYQALTPSFNDLEGISRSCGHRWRCVRCLVGRLCSRGDEVQQLFHIGLFVESLQFKRDSHPEAGMSRLHRAPQMQL